jgi:hypothetical protein
MRLYGLEKVGKLQHKLGKPLAARIRTTSLLARQIVEKILREHFHRRYAAILQRR